MATRRLKNIPNSIEVDVLKEAYKEAMKEWLDEQFTRFGRFTFYGLLSAGLAAMIYLILISQGWHR